LILYELGWYKLKEYLGYNSLTLKDLCHEIHPSHKDYVRLVKIATKGSKIDVSPSSYSENDMDSWDSDSDLDSIDYDYRPAYLPPIHFKEKNENSLLLQIYTPNKHNNCTWNHTCHCANTRCNIRCRHESRNDSFLNLKAGPNFICLCHGHGKHGVEYNLCLTVRPGYQLVNLSTCTPYLVSKFLYKGVHIDGARRAIIPSLVDLTMACMFSNNLFYLLYIKGVVPRDISKLVPLPEKNCLNVGCIAQQGKDCKADCITKAECDFYYD
jgi:hypothetical protein